MVIFAAVTARDAKTGTCLASESSSESWEHTRAFDCRYGGSTSLSAYVESEHKFVLTVAAFGDVDIPYLHTFLAVGVLCPLQSHVMRQRERKSAHTGDIEDQSLNL